MGGGQYVEPETKGKGSDQISDRGMSSQHQDVEYIPLDSDPSEPSFAPRSFASAKYAGHLFLATVLFAGVLVGGAIGRWATVPNVITVVPSTGVVPEPVHYEPVVTLLDSFIDMCVSNPSCLRIC